MLLLYSAFMPPDEQLTIIDAACEPHIVTLCTILEAMGARIEGIYSNLLRITWPEGRRAPAAAISLDHDFMEATTYAIAAALTRSDLTIQFQNAGIYLFLIDRYLGWMGVRTVLERDTWRILGSTSSLRIETSLSSIKAEPWPRFPTDVLSMFVVLATQCTGTLKFVEYMYDDRFGFIQSLRDIGARIDVLPPHAIIVRGPTPLSGNDLFLRPDIRSGAAMLLAALASTGVTSLHDRNNVIERGYQQLPETLTALGARITARTVTFD
jgi:UDP-N-acetylglucosamine 1-carboxyvinyltransferase